ncbi:hypothetical protein [Bradyrhizobium sp. BWA-3-5]
MAAQLSVVVVAVVARLSAVAAAEAAAAVVRQSVQVAVLEVVAPP